MSKEMGPREKALREMREARHARAMADAMIDLAPIRQSLKRAIAKAAKKPKARKK